MNSGQLLNPGGSPNMNVVGVPVGNFHEKPEKIPVKVFINRILTPKRYQKLDP